jgi:hypothetical protein
MGSLGLGILSLRRAKQLENRIFSASRSLHWFLPLILCLLFLGSPATAHESKKVLALYGNNTSLRAAASAGAKHRIDFYRYENRSRRVYAAAR